ncbi:hypothetical protein SAMN04489716_0714 [Actinoplanes derwentensis]|uniref:Uncharacterized protein n=2 Tax=Actinoplanes derwentensis TaxID=113562 RepID=A0A1H1RXX2_9ACTN|nr:hypothetical protein SAMN04489716_0714 [Actinoplanes derwentensis]
MQGVGNVATLLVSVLALWFTALLYLHEVRTRREEKADADAAHARLVFGRVVEIRAPTQMLTSMQCEVVNHGEMPIFQVTIEVTTSSGATVRDAQESDGLIGTQVRELIADQPIPVAAATTIRDLSLTVAFTDAAGLRWRRTGRDTPVRVLSGSSSGPDCRPWLALTAVTLGVLGIALTLISLFN